MSDLSAADPDVYLGMPGADTYAVQPDHHMGSQRV